MTLQDLLDDEYEEGKMAGIEEGRSVGIEEGQRSLLISMINRKLEKGKTIEEIADSLEMEDVVISKLIEEMNKN